jgi:hypothetical protein
MITGTSTSTGSAAGRKGAAGTVTGTARRVG